MSTSTMNSQPSLRIGLWIGESFAEARAEVPKIGASAPAIIQSRWQLARRSLTDGLKDFLLELGPQRTSGVLQIATTHSEPVLSRRQGHAPAVLVTAGFETFAKLQRPLISPAFSPRPIRTPSLASDDKVFGINERTSAQGEIQTRVTPEELEFLVAKLELLKIRSLAVCFLHATQNPENEQTTARFFRERGFFVTCSHEIASAHDQNEAQRWQKTIECAYTAKVADEEREQIEAALTQGLGEHRSNWQVLLWSEKGLRSFSEFSAATVRGGAQESLRYLSKNAKAKSTLHFGLEGFYFVVADQDDTSSCAVLPLPLQPTRQVGLGAWPVPSFGPEDKGYEPGPMLFGKSQLLTLLDILFVRNRLEKVESLNSLINERARARIMETLFTLGKMIPGEQSGPIDARDVAADLEQAAIERIANTISLYGARDRMHVTGSLAPAFIAQLRARRPDLSFDLDTEAEWSQVAACIRLSTSPLSTVNPQGQR